MKCRPACSAKTNFAHTIIKVPGAAQDFDFHAHEINGQIAAVQLGEADGVFLGGDDDMGLAFYAAIDGVEDFLLGEAVVIGEAF
jgi:hypothetical protein